MEIPTMDKVIEELDLFAAIRSLDSLATQLKDEFCATKIMREYQFAEEMKSIYNDQQTYNFLQTKAKKELDDIEDPKRKKELKTQYARFL